MIGEVLQPSDFLDGLLWACFSISLSFLCWGPPDMVAVLQVWSYNSGAGGQNHLPRPAGIGSSVTTQDPAVSGPHVSFHPPTPQVLLGRAALNVFSQSVLSGIVLTQVQHFALTHVEPHSVIMCPHLKIVQVPLAGTSSFCCVNCTSQLCVICKFAKVVLNLTVYVTDKGIRQHLYNNRALWHTTCHQPPPGYQAVVHSSLVLSIWPIPYPLDSSPFKPMTLQYGDRVSCGTMSKSLWNLGRWHQSLNPANELICIDEHQVQ